MQNTYLNPALDRGQMLLDIYEHEVRFCNAKTQVMFE